MDILLLRWKARANITGILPKRGVMQRRLPIAVPLHVIVTKIGSRTYEMSMERHGA